MDPYIESPELWADFHGNLAPEIQGRLNPLIQPKYVARLTPYVTYEVVEIGETRRIRPDLGVWHVPALPGGAQAGAAVITPPKAESRVPLEIPLTLNRVQIRTTADQVLVPVIEILSPLNKRPTHEAFAEYRPKRRDLLRSAVHLVEIDLLREGERPPLDAPIPAAPYYVLLSRADMRPKVEVWPIQFAEPLPVVPVPLLEPDPDVPLDLGGAVQAVYERGGYASQIDYRRPPPAPPLAPGEAEWLDGLLRPARQPAGGTGPASGE